MTDAPRHSVADVQRLAAAHLSLPSRMGHVLLLVVSLMMAAAIASLWATEPALPLRTRVAFAAIVAAGLGWAGFAAWVLARRRVLLGADRIFGASLGVALSTGGAAGMAAMGYWGAAGPGAYAGAVVHLALAGVAIVLLIRARRRVADLTRRRDAIEARLRGSVTGPRTDPRPRGSDPP